jgi:hypothetical protein
MSEFPWHAMAKAFLGEFGGIHVEVDGPGVARYRESFIFDPTCAQGEDDRFSDISREFDINLSPLGEFGQGEFFIAIDQWGVVYLLASAIFKLGCLDEALENLVTGGSLERVNYRHGDGG